MKPYKRPEKETDPDKAPGQTINRPPAHLSGTLDKEIEEFKNLPSGRQKHTDGCCHQTVLAGRRCSDCSFRDPETGSIGSP